LQGKAKPQTAEQLMRSRYTAFAIGDMKYLRTTLTARSRKDFDENAARAWSKNSKWKGLKVLSSKLGGAADRKGEVEFIATYEQDGEGLDHHEVAQFERSADGDWLFVTGDSHLHKEGEGHSHGHSHSRVETFVREEPKLGRNDPCHCGSGRKFKKCCGA